MGVQGFTEYGGDEVKDEFPVGFEFMTLDDVQLTLDVGAPVHPTEDCFIWVALSVVDENAAVEEFSPVFFFGGVGDGCAEGFPDEWPRDGDVGEAVFGGIGGGPRFFAVRSCVLDVWFGVVLRDDGDGCRRVTNMYTEEDRKGPRKGPRLKVMRSNLQI